MSTEIQMLKTPGTTNLDAFMDVSQTPHNLDAFWDFQEVILKAAPDTKFALFPKGIKGTDQKWVSVSAGDAVEKMASSRGMNVLMHFHPKDSGGKRVVAIDIDHEAGKVWFDQLVNKHNLQPEDMATREPIPGWFKPSINYYFTLSDAIIEEFDSKQAPKKKLYTRGGEEIGEFFHGWINQLLITPGSIRKYDPAKDGDNLFEPFAYTWNCVNGVLPVMPDEMAREVLEATHKQSKAGKSSLNGTVKPRVSKRNHIADYKSALVAQAIEDNGKVNRNDYILKTAFALSHELVNRRRKRDLATLIAQHADIMTAVTSVLTRCMDRPDIETEPRWSESKILADSTEIVTEAYNERGEGAEDDQIPPYAIAAMEALGEDPDAPADYQPLKIRFDSSRSSFWVYDYNRNIYVCDETRGSSKATKAIYDAWERRDLLEEYKVKPGKFHAEVLGYIERLHQCESDPKFRGEVVTKNGIVDFPKYMTLLAEGKDTGEAIRPATAEEFVIHYMDLDIDPVAKAPLFEQFVMKGCNYSQSAYKNLLAHIGLAFIPNMAQKSRKMVMLIGQKRTGKSILSEIVRYCFNGGDSRSHLATSVSISDWQKEFNLVQMEHALINTDNEFQRNTLNAPITKKIAAADPMQLRPLYRNAYNAVIEARQIICSNVDPEFTNDNYGIADRWMPITWVKQEGDKEDIFLKEKLQVERMGIINLCLIEAYEWIKRQRWVEPDAVQQETVDRIDSENGLYRFLQDNASYADGHWTHEYTLVKLFQAWLKDEGHHGMTSNEIKKRFNNMIDDGDHIPANVKGIKKINQIRHGGAKPRGIANLKFDGDCEKSLPSRLCLSEHERTVWVSNLTIQRQLSHNTVIARSLKKTNAVAMEIENRAELIDDPGYPEGVTFNVGDPFHTQGAF